jgi:poly [ADP-ribose] polymerase
LNQTSAGDNHNKYYRIQLLVSGVGNHKTWTRWGRVGAAGASAVLGDGSLDSAISHFQKKFKDKSGNSWENRREPARTGGKKAFYAFIERQYENDSSDEDDLAGSGNTKARTMATKTTHVESQLSKEVQDLMRLIFNKQYFEDTMRILDYDAEKLPLGQLSKRTLEQGFKALKDLGELLANPNIGDFLWAQSLERCSNMFYTLIPHNFGRQRPPIIRTEEALRKEICLMESLSDLEIANTIMEDRKNQGMEGDTVHPLDRQFAALNLEEMVPGE